MCQQINSLTHHGHKLRQLHHGQGRFPPNGQILSSLGYLGVHANKVVGVHDGMDESIQHNGEEDITIVLRIGIEPVEQKDGEVMVYMEEGKLSPFLSKNDEDGIPKIPDFRNVKEPKEVGHGWALVVVHVADGRVSVAIGNHACLDGHVCTEENLGHVVDEFDGVGVHGWNT